MKFVPLPLPETPADAASLTAEYRAGRGVGVITLGENHFFFRKFLTLYYIPYQQISRYFRRVETVPARIGCCGGELRVENIVLCAVNTAGVREREIAQIQLPGEKAARVLMEELRRLAPHAAAGKDAPPPGGGETDETIADETIANEAIASETIANETIANEALDGHEAAAGEG